MYLAPQNIPRAISVLTLGNKVILYCIVLYCLLAVSAEDICARSRTLKHSEEITCTVVKKKKKCNAT